LFEPKISASDGEVVQEVVGAAPFRGTEEVETRRHLGRRRESLPPEVE
jgi:hypothetical protein